MKPHPCVFGTLKQNLSSGKRNIPQRDTHTHTVLFFVLFSLKTISGNLCRFLRSLSVFCAPLLNRSLQASCGKQRQSKNNKCGIKRSRTEDALADRPALRLFTSRSCVLIPLPALFSPLRGSADEVMPEWCPIFRPCFSCSHQPSKISTKL